MPVESGSLPQARKRPFFPQLGANAPKKRQRRDIIAEARALREDVYERDSKRERESMIRFLAYLKPFTMYFVMASLCGVTIYLVPNLIPVTIGYVIDHMLGGSHPGANKHYFFLYTVIDSYLRHVAPAHASRATRVNILLGSLLLMLPMPRLFRWRRRAVGDLQAAQRALRAHPVASFVVLSAATLWKHRLAPHQRYSSCAELHRQCMHEFVDGCSGDLYPWWRADKS
jgi:hypothetical protein